MKACDYLIREKNSSRKFLTDSVWATRRCGNLTIIGQTNRKNKAGYVYFLCKFPTGSIVEASSSNIRNGTVADPCMPVVYGTGWFGIGEFTCSTHPKEYQTWNNMLKRCYSPTHLKMRPTYKNCTVIDTWLCFQNFCKDLPSIEGYEEWKANKKHKKYELDKDIKIPGNKVYNIDSCIFTTASKNSAESCIRTKVTGKTYEATNIITGEKEVFYNQSKFHREHNGASRMGSIFKYTRGKALYQGIWKIEEKAIEEASDHLFVVTQPNKISMVEEMINV